LRYELTLYFNDKQSALDAGYFDAVLVDDDVPDLGYMAVITFFCDGYEIERNDESLDVDLGMTA
jgi:hypothetical protein